MSTFNIKSLIHPRKNPEKTNFMSCAMFFSFFQLYVHIKLSECMVLASIISINNLLWFSDLFFNQPFSIHCRRWPQDDFSFKCCFFSLPFHSGSLPVGRGLYRQGNEPGPSVWQLSTLPLNHLCRFLFRFLLILTVPYTVTMINGWDNIYMSCMVYAYWGSTSIYYILEHLSIYFHFYGEYIADLNQCVCYTARMTVCATVVFAWLVCMHSG